MGDSQITERSSPVAVGADSRGLLTFTTAVAPRWAPVWRTGGCLLKAPGADLVPKSAAPAFLPPTSVGEVRPEDFGIDGGCRCCIVRPKFQRTEARYE